jgi:succinate dehydrogenase flavin-adding protein (antitoxin of CptAB toxin-antitoxin module)
MAGVCSLPIEESQRRLRWRFRRGLLELDVWLERFAAVRLAHLSQAQCGVLETLLQETDADLLAWFQGRQPVPEAYREMVSLIRTAV